MLETPIADVVAIEQAVYRAKECVSQLDNAGILRTSRDFHKLHS